MSLRQLTQRYQGASGVTRPPAAAADRAVRRIASRFAPLGREITFTVDLEEHRRGHDAAACIAPTRRLLDLLEEAEGRGTFFVLGETARAVPALVRDVAARGHEIASHGMAHRPLDALGPAELATDLADSRALLEDLAGQPVRGYRAPLFSLTPRVPGAPEAVARAGYAYSSSVLPAWSPLRGWPGAPGVPFLWPSGVLEIPCPVAPLGPLRLPLLGGMYLRYLPPWRLSQLARRMAATPGLALWSYCHPYDVEEGVRFAEAPGSGVAARLFLWMNRGGMATRLEALLRGRVSEPFAARLPALREAAAVWAP
jgi:polysaccharide deacetylase family protein (PEP-CTERM system associated)